MDIPENSTAFYRHLNELQSRFDSMKPELEVTVRDATLQVEGHIVVWNTAISKAGPLTGCGKGGTRIRAGLTLQEVKTLARTMALKNAAAGLPLGGSKSGLNAMPGHANFEQQYRRFVQLCKPFLYENGGAFGGFGFDIGAAPEHAIWACDELGSTCSFTGKPAHMGGTDYDREGIAGLGVAEAAATLMDVNRKQITATDFAVHGAGAMGSAVIRYFSAMGAKLCALGDPKYNGSWRFDHGVSEQLHDALITQRIKDAQRLIEIEGSLISSDANDVLFEHCTVLFPCALQAVITADNADRVNASYLVEAANNPCTPEAIAMLQNNGIALIPDFIANSGGIIAAYTELVNEYNNDTIVGNKIENAKNITREKIRDNIIHLSAVARQLDVSLRDAGLHFSLARILD